MDRRTGRQARPRAAVAAAWVDRTVDAASSVGAPVAVTVLGALLVLVWGATWLGGGTRNALPHLCYVPIALASLPFGRRGTVVTALVAALLMGPLMPLDTSTGEAQLTSAWLLRGLMFVLVGYTMALAATARTRRAEQRLTDELHTTLMASLAPGQTIDRDLVPLVADVLAHRRFHPVYQPIFALSDGRLVGVEALTRFDVEPARSPDQWFGAAQLAGCSADLELAAIRAALEGARDLPPHVELSVNASPATLADPRLGELLASRAGREVVVEITEHAVVEDYAGLQEAVDALRALGVRLAVDDAGAGIASFRHIVQLGPDIIKVDISLTQEVATSPLRRALAGSLIEFAERTGAQLLVEGLEQLEDLATWTRLGAHTAQGYLVGRPGPLPVPAVSSVIAAQSGPRVPTQGVPPAAVRA